MGLFEKAPRATRASSGTDPVPGTKVGEVHLFPKLPYESFPFQIAAGPDGSMWFTEFEGDRIGRITTSGTVTEFAVPTAGGGPYGITAGPDGNIWFTESKGNNIGRITPTGAITEFPLPTPDGEPVGITAAPDGNLWFTESGGNKIGRITPTGEITEFPLPTAESAPGGITVGPDGNVWFTEFSRIGRITLLGDFVGNDGRPEISARILPTHTVSEFSIETINSEPSAITAGPDGNLWFTESGAGQIGRITPTGAITEFAEGIFRNELGSSPSAITTGDDGNVWFTDGLTGRIGRITPTGTVTEFLVDQEYSEPAGIAANGDTVWFTERNANRIGWIRARNRVVTGPNRPTGPLRNATM